MKMVVINEIPFYYKVIYDKGGENIYTRQPRRRGYYLSIQRQQNRFAIFAGLEEPDGAGKVFVEEARRYSIKRFQEIKALAEEIVIKTVKEVMKWDKD